MSLTAALMLALAVVSSALAASLAAAPAAQAHDQLISSNPADGAVLSEVPGAVELVFSADLMDLGNEVRVEDASGADVTAGELRLQREVLAQPLAPSLAEGTYRVTWRAVSSDGHPITGGFAFTVGSAGSGNDAGATPDPDRTDGSSAQEATAGPQATAGTGQGSAEAANQAEGAGLPGWVPAAAVGAAVGLGIYAAVVWLRRRTHG